MNSSTNSHDIEYSFFNTSKMLTEGKITKEFIIEQLSSDLVKKIKSDSIKEGFWSFAKVMALLEQASESYYEEILSSQYGQQYLFNAAYIMPDLFIKAGQAKSKFYLHLTDEQYASLLSRGSHYKEIDKLLEDEIEWYMQPRKVLNFLFRLTTSKTLSATTEKNRIDAAIQAITRNSNDKKYDEDFGHLIELMKARSNALNPRSKSNTDIAENKRIALLICGQLRGYEAAIPTIAAAFNKPHLVDVYISTWDDIGWGALSIERLSRFFEKNAYDYVLSKYEYQEIRIIIEKLRNQSSGYNIEQAKEFIKQQFLTFNSIHFNSFDDSKYPFNRMNNSEKMYFHNSYWIETLGEKKFLEYSKIVKIRPDLKLVMDGTYFDDIKMEEETIYVENHGGWIFRDWGFGIGDQIIFGLTTPALKVLNCHGEAKISTKVLKCLNKTNFGYSGHRNCGIVAWSNGYDCDVSQVRPIEICNIAKFTLDQVKLVETQ